MKKFEIAVDGKSQTFCASREGLAAILAGATSFKTLKTGESQTMTVRVVRLPYTKADKDAREAKRSAKHAAAQERQARWEESHRLKVGDVAFHPDAGRVLVRDVLGDQAALQCLPMVGDVITDDTGKFLGRIVAVDGSESSGLLDGSTTVVDGFNVDLGVRSRKLKGLVGCSEELAALGLG